MTPRAQGWVLLEGRRYDLLPYGHETVEGLDPYQHPCVDCDAEPGTGHRPPCSERAIHARPARCPECDAALGEIHQLGCTVEVCPRCEHQYMRCGCEGSEDTADPDRA
jgi:hypothetical protein